jgi:hypothetical protein
MDKPTTQSILPDDKERLRTLYQEVVARLEEASVIVRRQLGKQHLGLGAASVTLGSPLVAPPQIYVPAKSGEEKFILKVICAEGFCFVDEHGNCIGVEDAKEQVCRPC